MGRFVFHSENIALLVRTYGLSTACLAALWSAAQIHILKFLDFSSQESFLTS
jgi:hypothetical protein